MTDHVCNPAQHPTWPELKSHCEEKHDSQMEWAKEVIKASKDDRETTKDRVTKLENWKDKLFWVILLAAIGIIATNIIGPKLARNGDAEMMMSIKNEVREGNAISMQNQTKIQKLEERLGVK